jgi:transcriptional pleiotropic regulator of transition state genes
MGCYVLLSAADEREVRKTADERMKTSVKTSMKATGIVRKIDDLGRIVLPIELRRTLGISDRDSLEIYVDQNSIVLRKYEPACVFCASSANVMAYKDKNICADCLEELVKQK